VAKARVNLKGVTRAVDRLTKDLKKLEKQAASAAEKREMGALRRKLTKVRAMVAAECPPGMFRAFGKAPARARKRGRKGR